MPGFSLLSCSYSYTSFHVFPQYFRGFSSCFCSISRGIYNVSLAFTFFSVYRGEPRKKEKAVSLRFAPTIAHCPLVPAGKGKEMDRPFGIRPLPSREPGKARIVRQFVRCYEGSRRRKRAHFFYSSPAITHLSMYYTSLSGAGSLMNDFIHMNFIYMIPSPKRKKNIPLNPRILSRIGSA
jgi:hypothetical protein